MTKKITKESYNEAYIFIDDFETVLRKLTPTQAFYRARDVRDGLSSFSMDEEAAKYSKMYDFIYEAVASFIENKHKLDK